MTILLETALLAGAAGVARADDMPDCIDPMSQVELTYCAAIDYETADAELNAIWPDIVAAAKSQDQYVAEQVEGTDVPTTLQALRNAQRAWITFRDAQCEYEAYEVFGGTSQSMVGSLCLARLTRERIEVLSRTLQNR
ncbi:lysozyme inhibitor LprI family protein [Hoeflea halophila]|uniref:lysozyme inhibitor LprI family protein n=1 Tax=Hoeflea halophila TaxID=714899 RepID=UPI0015C7BC87|nr:lysozyme inhibitor LprI family protein [Hoeflea halophila]